VDFENTVDRGSAVNFGTDSGFNGCPDVPKQNLDYVLDLSSALIVMLMSSSTLFNFFE